MRTNRASSGIRNQYKRSVASSRLRHHDWPGLQADQRLNRVKAKASAIEIGTILSMVSPAM